MKRSGLVCLLAVASWAMGADKTPRVPTVDDLLMVRSVAEPEISPDGKRVAYTVRETDFKQDAFVSQIWLADTSTGGPLQLTRSTKSSSNPQWSPDGAWLAFTSNRAGDKSQIFAIRPEGGEAMQLSKSETGINGFAWSRDGRSIAYTASEPAAPATKDRKDYLGAFTVVRRDYEHVHLWTSPKR
jgi:dipeptidyl aminopeptidase/acylaminoacyl peptidase